MSAIIPVLPRYAVSFPMSERFSLMESFKKGRLILRCAGSHCAGGASPSQTAESCSSLPPPCFIVLFSRSALLFGHKVVDGSTEQHAQCVEVIDVRQRPSCLPVIHGLRTHEVQIPLHVQNRAALLDPAAEDALPHRPRRRRSSPSPAAPPGPPPREVRAPQADDSSRERSARGR